MTEFNASRYNECEKELGHNWGYNEHAGSCEHCGLIHNCEVEQKYELADTPFEGWRCAICHHYADNDVIEEIEQANIDSRETEGYRYE